MCSEKQKSKGAHTHIHIHPKRERKGETRVVTFSPEYIWYIFMAVGAVKTDFCLRFQVMSLSSKFLLCLQVSNPIIFPIQKLGFDSVITTLTISLDSDPQSTLLPPYCLLSLQGLSGGDFKVTAEKYPIFSSSTTPIIKHDSLKIVFCVNKQHLYLFFSLGCHLIVCFNFRYKDYNWRCIV